jgi:CubicO group peptidase (beta-lactamase class C family)
MRKDYALVIMLLVMGCEPAPKNQDAIGPVKGSSLYQPPHFSDDERIEKIARAVTLADAIYKNYAAENHFPSIAYGIIADGKLIHSGSYGEANLNAKQAASTKTLYRIASMTKSFTAMAILKLRDEGKLSLQDPAAKYMPSLNDIHYLTNDSPLITIQDLMTMSAGFPEDNPWGDRQLEDSDEDLIKLIQEGLSFSNAPGLQYEYSNLGFAMLGNIITQLSGMPYQQYISEQILKPLQMNDTEWEYTNVPATQLALGYHWVNDQWQEEPILHDGAFGAMGGLISSIEDFSKYVAFHLAAWPPRNDPETGPVKRSTVREMHQLWRVHQNSPGNDAYGPVVFGYAYGLGWRKDARGILRIAHSGGLPGYGSEWRIYPDYGIGVVSFSNRRYGAPSLANAMVMDTLVAVAQLAPRVIPVSIILEQRKAGLLANLPDWQELPGLFADNFYMDKPLDLRRKEVSDIFEAAGEIVSTSDLVPENQLRGTFIITCSKRKVQVFFTLTPENNPLIQQLNLRLMD